jgi:hypothetical protein
MERHVSGLEDARAVDADSAALRPAPVATDDDVAESQIGWEQAP